MARLTRKTYDELNSEQQRVFDKIAANRPVTPADGHIGGPFDVWLRSPEMGEKLVDLGSFFRFNTSVDRRYIEVVILVTGQFWQAQFEWWAHEPMARKAGVPYSVITPIKQGTRPEFDNPKDAAAYQLAHDLHTTRQVSPTTYEHAVAQFGEIGVAELIGLCGFYSLVSMTLNGFDVDLPEGATPPFPNP